MLADARGDYRMLAPGAEVFFRCDHTSQQQQQYLLGLADNISMGGLFIATDRPLRPGTVLHMRLYGDDDPSHTRPLGARAMVRWRRVWGKPRGMGVQFLEFEGLGERRVESWLDCIARGAWESRPRIAAVA